MGKTCKYIIGSTVLILSTIMFACEANAGVSLPWSSTISCSDWNTSQGDPTGCAGWEHWASDVTAGGHRTGFTSSANYPLGAGGSGYRAWVGASGTAAGGPRIAFNTGQTDVWVRFYLRFQTGLHFSDYWKCLYFGTNGSPSNSSCLDIGTSDGQGITVTNVGGGSTNTWTSDSGETFSKYWGGGGSSSNGSWHCVELHVKSETVHSAPYDGVTEVWIDGHRTMNITNANHGLHSSGLTLTYLRLGVNMAAENSATITSDYYIDFDDFAISNTGYIGPLASSGSSPVANFNATPLSGTTSLTSTFTDTSTNSPTSWAWDFDNDGTTDSTLQNPTHQYTTAGTYSVKLTATNAYGSNSITKTSYITVNAGSSGTTLFSDSFDNSSFSARGWYDNTAQVTTTSQHYEGTGALQWAWAVGDITPTGGASMRKLFTASDSVYVSYWVKHSSNWVGSNLSTHPHLFYVLTDTSDAYSQLAWTKTTAYIEENSGVPRLGLQDGANVNKTGTLPNNLCSTTENRAVNGCNGNCDSHTTGSCYAQSSEYMNGRYFDASGLYFSDTAGPYYKGDWHHVEAYFQMNSIVGGVAQADGVVRYWYDGTLIIDHADVIIKTNQNASMKFNQFILGPYMGVASPVAQTMWIDNLTVSTSRSGDASAPAIPSGVQIQILN
jgi:PKD repeat protein